MWSVADSNSKQAGLKWILPVLSFFAVIAAGAEASIERGSLIQRATFAVPAYDLHKELVESTKREIRSVYAVEEVDEEGDLTLDEDLLEADGEGYENFRAMDESGVDEFDDSSLSEHVPDDVDWFF